MGYEKVCPRCKTSEYQNPNLTLLISVCGHSLCKDCVELLFVKGSGNCVECGLPLRRSDLRTKLFEDNLVEKDIIIRSKLIKEYYKTEDDFETLREYNDYLEEFEDMVYNLTHNIDVQAVNDKIERYRKECKEQILKCKMKYGRSVAELESMVEEEVLNKRYETNVSKDAKILAKKRKALEKEALIDELSYSENDAKSILNFFTESRSINGDQQPPSKNETDDPDQKQSQNPLKKKLNQFSSGQTIGSSSIYGRVPKLELAPLYVYQPLAINIDGPQYPEEEEIATKGYLSFIRPTTPLELAGGFRNSSVCSRLLQEAMFGLYYVPLESKEEQTS